MLGADDEVGIERPGRRIIGPFAVELIEEPGDEVELGVGGDRLLAGPQPCERGECGGRERSQRPGLPRGRRPGELLGGSPHGDRRPERVHRLGGPRQGPEGDEHGIRHGRGRQVVARIPLASPQEVRHGGIRPVLDEVADPVAAIEELARLAVHVAERCLRRYDALKAR